MEWFQQGDVLIQPIANIPERAEKQDHNILARGEATGHSHTVHGTGAAVYSYAQILYMDAPEGAEILHEEHRPVPVPAGKYRIGLVREYDHFLERERTLED